MLASKIKLNQEYAVSVEWLDAPRTYPLVGGGSADAGAQSDGRRNPSTHGNRHYSLVSQHQRRATVIAKGVDRYVFGSGWSSKASVKKDGILVEFSSPVRASLRDGVEVTRAVVSSKFVTSTWEEHEARVASIATAKATKEQAHREGAVALAERLSNVREQLAAVGLDVNAESYSFAGPGFSIALNYENVDGEQVATGYRESEYRVDRRLFEQLVAIAAKHGEVVA